MINKYRLYALSTAKDDFTEKSTLKKIRSQRKQACFLAKSLLPINYSMVKKRSLYFSLSILFNRLKYYGMNGRHRTHIQWLLNLLVD
jgi:hypothetical protein